MQDFPHLYRASAGAGPEGPVVVSADAVPDIHTAAPAEFGGPGDQWSPETLLVAAIVDCFILSFKAIARASKVEWLELRCEGEATLDRVDRVTRFTAVQLKATLRIPEGTPPERAERILQKAEESCLITNSLLAETHLEAQLEIG